MPPTLYSLNLILLTVSALFCPISTPVATTHKLHKRYVLETPDQKSVTPRVDHCRAAGLAQAGVDIVPVYGLGHTQLFSMLDKSSALGGFLMRMSRRLKAWNILEHRWKPGKLASPRGGCLEVALAAQMGTKLSGKLFGNIEHPTLKVFKTCKQY